MDRSKIEKIHNDVASRIGTEVHTHWGPCIVMGIVTQNNEPKIHLKEFGEEDFVIDLEHWYDSLI